jgi:DNA polymerase-3 subunit alpha
VDDMREILTKKGDKMVFGKISDITGSIDIVIFPRAYKEYAGIFKPNEVFAFNGKLERTEED